jgi:glutathione S-transferase
MSIELYLFPPSPRSFKVLAVANHLGIEYTLRFVDLRTGAQKTPQYAALNPNMRAPALKDGDFVLWESNAIAQYLAAKRPESGLWPAEERARSDIARWQFWETAHWDPACAVFIFERVAKPAVLGITEVDSNAIAKGIEPFHAAARVLDAQLRGRKFVTGETLTLADYSVGAVLNLAELAQLPLEPYREIKRWFAALSALPAWQRTRAQATMPAAAAAA